MFKTGKYCNDEKSVNPIDMHSDLCNMLHDIYIQKNTKYGDSFSRSIDKYGNIAALTRISDKFNRLESLILANQDGSDTDESIRDTLLDLANYALMTYIELEK